MAEGMSEDDKDLRSSGFKLYADQAPPVVTCIECDHQFDSGHHFFRCYGCKSEPVFELCQQCALKDDNPSTKYHALQPCILDPKDSRPTFLPRPNVAQFRRLLSEAELDPSRIFSLYFENFAVPTLRKSLVTTVGFPPAEWKVGAEPHGQAIASMVGNDYSKYTQLDAEKKDIRLFKLLPGPDEKAPVTGFLARFSYPWDQVKWASLSYCWGDLSATRPIQILHLDNRLHDGNEPSYRNQIFAVTANLEMALRNMRGPDQDLWLWVDALCINQGDLDERASQVGIMRDIYSHASSVGIWLGLSSSSELQNAGVVQVIGQVVEEYQKKNNTSRIPMSMVTNSRITMADRTLARAEVVRALSSFFDNPWFQRVWVLQEVWSARQDVAILVRRHLTIPWRYVHHVHLFLSMTMATMQPGAAGEASIKSLVEPWEKISRDHADTSTSADLPTPPILSLVSAVCRKFKATDARDKIFALLAMGSETHELQRLPRLLEINYRKPVHEVFADFTRWCILEQQSLDVLGHVSYNDRSSYGNDSSQSQQWPSWALSPQVKHSRNTTVSSVTEFRACGNTTVDLSLIENHDHQLQLHLRGFRLSKVLKANEKYFQVRWHISDELCVMDDETNTWYTGGLSWMWRAMLVDGNKAPKDCSPGPTATGPCTCQLAMNEWLLLLTWGGMKEHGDCDHAQGIHRAKWLAPQDMYADFAAYWVRQGQGQDDPQMQSFCEHVRQVLLPLVEQGTRKGFLQLLMTTAGQKCFFVTDDGRPGFCPPGTRAGDAVVVLCGGRAPCILRPLAAVEGNEPQWLFIGECYIHKSMDGRRVKALVDAGNAGEVFTLV